MCGGQLFYLFNGLVATSSTSKLISGYFGIYHICMLGGGGSTVIKIWTARFIMYSLISGTEDLLILVVAMGGVPAQVPPT